MYYPKDFEHLKPTKKIVVLDRRRKKIKSSAKEIPSVWEEFCKESSFHGLQYIQDSSLPLLHRGFWFVTFMMSLSASIMTVITTYQNIYLTQIETSLSPESSSIKDVPFPTVMICSSFPVRKSYFNLDIPGGNKNFRHYSKMVCPDEEALAGETYNSSLTEEFFHFLNEASIPCNQFLVNCRWNNIEEDCCDMFKPFITHLGKCYVFNSFPEKEVYKKYTFPVGFKDSYDEQTQLWRLQTGYPDRAGGQKVYPRWSEIPGAITGLTVTIMENRSEWQQDCSGGASGSSLILYTALENPESMDKVKIPAQLHTKIQVKPTIIHSVPDMKSVDVEDRLCVYQNEIVLKYYNTYNYYNCLHECFIDKSLEKCGCASFEYHGALASWNKPFCGDEQSSCLEEVINKVFQIPSGPEDTTKCTCLPLCTTLSYDIESSFEQRDPRVKKLQTATFNHSYGTIVSQVSVFFPRNEFMNLIRKNVATFGDSLSNCGGLLGLLLGFSFMSAYEVCFFIVVRPILKVVKKYLSR